MPYRRHEPVSESEMARDRYHGHHTICEKLREMYYRTDDPQMKLDIRLCVAFAKSMNKKLQYYKHVYIDKIPPGEDEVREIREDGNA